MKLKYILPTLMLGFGVSMAPPIQQAKTVTTEITSANDLLSTKSDLINYYGNVQYLVGEDLITNLEKTIEKDNVRPPYSGKLGSVDWATYALADRDFNKSPLTNSELIKLNNGTKTWWDTRNVNLNVLYEENPVLFKGNYQTTNPATGKQKYVFDREHVYPKSHGFNGGGYKYDEIMAGCDIHNLHIAESTSNTLHSNHPYGEVKNPDEINTSLISKKPNGWLGRGETVNFNSVYEPIEMDKGDVARSIFYMATRYHTYDSKNPAEPRLIVGNSNFNTTTKDPVYTKDHDVVYGIKDDLLNWNNIDPITNNEKIRNEVIYRYIQNNRNPYSDFPKWVEVAFDPNTKYYADINQPDGVGLIFDFKDSSKLKDFYTTTDTIDLKSIGFTLLDNKSLVDVPFNKINITLTNLDTETSKDISGQTSIVINKGGNYEISFKTNSHPHSLVKKFTVEEITTDRLIVNNQPGKIYTLNERFDPTTLEVNLYHNETNTPILLSDSNLKITLTDLGTNESQVISKDKPYKFEKLGKYSYELSYLFNGQTFTKEFIIDVKTFDETLVIEGLDTLKDKYYVEDSIDVSKIKAKCYVNGSERNISNEFIDFTLYQNDIDTLTCTFADLENNQIPLYEEFSSASITIRHPITNASVKKDIALQVIDWMTTIKLVGFEELEAKTYYAGDTLTIPQGKITYSYKGTNYEKSSSQIDYAIKYENGTQEDSSSTTYLKEGKNTLVIMFHLPDMEYIEFETDIVLNVKSLQSGSSINKTFKEEYFIGDSIDFTDTTIKYIQNGEEITLGYEDLSITISSESNDEPIKVSDGKYKFTEDKKYDIELSFQNQNGDKISYNYNIVCKPALDRTLIYITIGGAAGIIIIASIIIFAVSRKRKKRR